MKAKQFNGIVDKQFLRSRDILVSKAGEYATDDDRLHNFKIAAALEGCTNRQAVAGFMAKHTVSIYDMCQSDQTFDMDVWDEKITDHMNYLFLLRAVLQDEAEDIQAEGTFPAFQTGPARRSADAYVKSDGTFTSNL